MGLVIARDPRRAAAPRSREIESQSHDIETEHVDCPLCGSSKFAHIVEAPDFETGLGGSFRVVQCQQCGLAFTNPRPTVASIRRFYGVDYEPHQRHVRDPGWRRRLHRGLEHAVLRSYFNYPPRPAGAWTRVAARIGHAWIRGRRRRSAWLPFRGPGRLLDFGCGAAEFARQMKQYGWSVEGLDCSASVAAQANREMGMQVHVGTLPHPAVRPDSLDAITMWSSLEHVHDPGSVLHAAREALRPQGILLVGVPNLDSWSFRAFRECWFGLDLPRHLFHFTPETLSAWLRRSGFRVSRLQQIGRDGWLRKSASRARQVGLGSRWLRAHTWKPLALARSRWSEWARQAESIVALAERD